MTDEEERERLQREGDVAPHHGALHSAGVAGIGVLAVRDHQAGDDGVRSVQSVTLGTSYVSGQVHVVAFRLVAELAEPVGQAAPLEPDLVGGQLIGVADPVRPEVPAALARCHAAGISVLMISACGYHSSMMFG